ncbi:unnamed protein product [Adineta ricciae]|uniref:G-protein coupled receptors family 1 profile domain-containing protein n=1 Tax=Adineta ricciae TaxID=249248 RepID=A0A815LEF8_ADIRI|nr:unnamed protein product [Adineta ricciae]CAF1404998.1 unnamed protein product [Adineta ricciae]
MNISNTTVMPNTTNSNSNIFTFMGYYCLLIVILGTIFNLCTFAVLCRSVFRNTQARPMIHYMRAIAIIDFLGLYGWTLDTYFNTIYGFTLKNLYTVASCKFSMFFNYWTLQISAWLHVFVCFDRYLFMSRIQPNTWFNRSKSVLIIIGCIIGIFFLSNFPILLFICYRNTDGHIVIDSQLVNMLFIFQHIHLWMYDLIPSTLILLFNVISIRHLYRLRRTTTIRNSKIRHRPITITLIITSFLYVVTRTPSTVVYSYFSDTVSATQWGRGLNIALNLLLYTFPVLNFPIYFMTFTEFRQNLLNFIRRRV